MQASFDLVGASPVVRVGAAFVGDAHANNVLFEKRQIIGVNGKWCNEVHNLVSK